MESARQEAGPDMAGTLLDASAGISGPPAGEAEADDALARHEAFKQQAESVLFDFS